jgi:hypothetical protein
VIPDKLTYVQNLVLIVVFNIYADNALMLIKFDWKNTPPSWDNSDDPCGGHWDGIVCINSRITAMYFRLKKTLLEVNFFRNCLM